MSLFLPVAKRTNPAGLGFILPTAGSPLNVTSNFTDLTGVSFQSLMLAAPSSNSARVWVLSNSSAADKTNGTNVIAVLAPGQSVPFTALAVGGIIPSQFYIDVDTTGDYVVPAVFTA